MKITIVIPSYNQAQFFRETLESIFLQEDPDLEVMVFDAGSTDGTVEILKEYDSRLEWVSRPDKGQTDAINQGLLKSKGDIVCYLNSDDVLLPGSLAAVREYFLSNGDCEVLYGDAYHLWEETGERDPYPTEKWDYDRLLDTCYLCQPAVFWRRSVIERYGYFDDTLHLAMDYEYWLRVGKHVDFHWLEGTFLAGSRMYEDNKTLRLKLKVHEETLQVALRHATRAPFRWLKVLANLRAGDRQAKEGFSEKDKTAIYMENIQTIADKYDITLDETLHTIF
jgi:glycosyltransferase involved in cell wall biosynthesis